MRSSSALLLNAARHLALGSLAAASSCTARDLPSTPAACTSATPALADPPGLHNLHAIGFDGGFISGAVPEGDAGFDTLEAMGVKTVISVDGAIPDVERAHARGMRYIHIPITYATVTPNEQLRLSRAVRDSIERGKVFIHCHHGKHRSPAAAAAVAVALGEATPAEGTGFMHTAGTAQAYAGLYACVAAAAVIPARSIDAVHADFPAVQKPEGMVAAMVEVDVAFENLVEVRDAGWQTPPNHPDLVPAAEAGRLVDQLRYSREDPRSKARGADYESRIVDAIARATALENVLATQPASTGLIESRFRLVQASCRSCHETYRNQH